MFLKPPLIYENAYVKFATCVAYFTCFVASEMRFVVLFADDGVHTIESRVTSLLKVCSSSLWTRQLQHTAQRNKKDRLDTMQRSSETKTTLWTLRKYLRKVGIHQTHEAHIYPRFHL